MQYDQRVIIRFLCKERVSSKNIHARLEAQFRSAIYSERSLRRWCQYVGQRREDLHDDMGASRRPIDFLNIRILALLDEQSFHWAYSIAEALGVSHSMTLSHLRESLGMKNFHLCWISHELAASLRQIRMEPCRELLPILNAQVQINFKDLSPGTRIGSFWNFIILRNGAYGEIMCLKR
jgi:hypothetical protein